MPRYRAGHGTSRNSNGSRLSWFRWYGSNFSNMAGYRSSGSFARHSSFTYNGRNRTGFYCRSSIGIARFSRTSLLVHSRFRGCPCCYRRFSRQHGLPARSRWTRMSGNAFEVRHNALRRSRLFRRPLTSPSSASSTLGNGRKRASRRRRSRTMSYSSRRTNRCSFGHYRTPWNSFGTGCA